MSGPEGKSAWSFIYVRNCGYKCKNLVILIIFFFCLWFFTEVDSYFETWEQVCVHILCWLFQMFVNFRFSWNIENIVLYMTQESNTNSDCLNILA